MFFLLVNSPDVRPVNSVDTTVPLIRKLHIEVSAE